MRKKQLPTLRDDVLEQVPFLVKQFGKWPAFLYLVLATLCPTLFACIFLLLTKSLH
jgi:hypothetical protein